MKKRITLALLTLAMPFSLLSIIRKHVDPEGNTFYHDTTTGISVKQTPAEMYSGSTSSITPHIYKSSPLSIKEAEKRFKQLEKSHNLQEQSGVL